ncbi:MAG: serine/threonine protein kinase [Actinomycetota bacterium]|nr:serine/threonine protein kinase [Actinomycetota bacterium]
MPESDESARVGAYELLAKIGEGGMSVVHLAQAPNGHRVAIKLLRPHVVGDDQGRARMAREVTSLRRVRSPRVAEVYDADPWGDTPYVVIRYVPGLSLHDHVEQRGPIAGDDLIAFARGLAEALVAVHLVDVLHRDVKPSNVLMEGRNPVLIDFGLAQLSDDSRLTHSGWLLGTPGYLAPEILYGDDPSPKADVHSWAATVVFAASGSGPYGKGPALAVMDRVRRGEHNISAVPEPLYWAVARALLPDPRERPTADQLVEWLGESLAASHSQSSEPQSLQGLVQAEGAPLVSARSASRPAAVKETASTWTPPEHQEGYAEPAAAPVDRSSLSQGGYSATPWPPIRNGPGWVASTTLWLLVLALVVAGAMAAPVTTAALLFVGGWFLRTLAFRRNRLEEWRRQRGPRRNDSTVATICFPWFSVQSLPAALANAGVAVVDGAIVVIITVLTSDPSSPGLVLALGGLVAALFVSWGPLSGDVREGGKIVARTLLHPGAPTMMVLVLVAVAALAVLGVWATVGPSYGPLPEPPWERSLRSLVR